MDEIKVEVDTETNSEWTNFAVDQDIPVCDVKHDAKESCTGIRIVEETMTSVTVEITVDGVQNEDIDDKLALPSDVTIKQENSQDDSPEQNLVAIKVDYHEKLAYNVLNKKIYKKRKSCLGSDPGTVTNKKRSVKKKQPTKKKYIIENTFVKCIICDEKLTKAALKDHKRLHKAPYECKICKKTFNDKNYFVHTHKVMHAKGERFTCDLCKKSFANKSTVKTHLSSHIEFNKHLYICFDCNKNFTKKCHLVEHYRIHTGYKPYKCNICDKEFTFKSCWNKHMNIHKAGLHNCEICSMNFMKQKDLEKHLKSHSLERRHTCSECGRKFVKSSHLKEHLRKHTGEQPYICNECGRAFSHNNSLTKHKRIHTGERPYNCEACGHGFTQIGNYKRHMLKHTSNNNLENNVEYMCVQDPLDLLDSRDGS